MAGERSATGKDPDGPVLRFAADEWTSFMDRVRSDS